MSKQFYSNNHTHSLQFYSIVRVYAPPPTHTHTHTHTSIKERFVFKSVNLNTSTVIGDEIGKCNKSYASNKVVSYVSTEIVVKISN
ncbi:hypothetical protein MtrunA17_Chr3g0100481 [Medicago truncatula]|uniref:Uncharacterized protein n=1 Tax=Medicago truncatula TaxID=3880 RepID=A0A396IPI9_MEDTR|nr:hypothetical protein MtrunA17_Chr3g0100481 [Medicago truncatula]